MNLAGEDKRYPAADDSPSSLKRKRKEDDATESENTCSDTKLESTNVAMNVDVVGEEHSKASDQCIMKRKRKKYDATETENTDSASESERASVSENATVVGESCSKASDHSVIEERTSEDLDYDVAEIKTEVEDPDYYTSVPNISDADVKTEPEEMDYRDDGVMQKSHREEESATVPFVANVKTEDSESEETFPSPVPVKVVQNFHSMLKQTLVPVKISSTSDSKATGNAKKSKHGASVVNTFSAESIQKTTKASTVHSANNENRITILNTSVVASNPPVQLISGTQPVSVGNPNLNCFRFVKLNAIPGAAQCPGVVKLVNSIQPSVQLLETNQKVVLFPTAVPYKGKYQNVTVLPALDAPASQAESKYRIVSEPI